jgi:hypothetical protein
MLRVAGRMTPLTIRSTQRVQPAAGRPRRDQRPDDDRGGGHQQLADAAATSRPMTGITMALLGHARAQPSGRRLSSGAPARGWVPTRICAFTGSLHEAVPDG